MLRKWTRVRIGLFSAALLMGVSGISWAQEYCGRRGFFTTWKGARLVGYRGPYAGGCENPYNGPPNRWFDATGRWTGDGPENPMSTYKQPCPTVVISPQPIRSN